jgi:hypothetical protein
MAFTVLAPLAMLDFHSREVNVKPAVRSMIARTMGSDWLPRSSALSACQLLALLTFRLLGFSITLVSIIEID